jgi:plasmid replication protein
MKKLDNQEDIIPELVEFGKSTKRKARYWTVVVYPESSPPDWVEQVKQTHLAYLISPIHDKDLTAVGDYKKPHYHLVLMWENPTTFANVREVLKPITEVCPQAVNNLGRLARYLVHMDDPDKAQYDVADIQSGGVDLEEMLYSQNNRAKQFELVHRYCLEHNITEYKDLLDRTLEDDMTVYHAAINNVSTVKAYLISWEHKIQWQREMDAQSFRSRYDANGKLREDKNHD